MKENKALKYIIAVLSVAYVAFHIYTAVYGTFIPQLQRPLHLTFAVVIGFLCYPMIEKRDFKWLDTIFAAIATGAFGYVAYRYQDIAVRQTMVSPLSTLDLIVGGIIIVLLLEITRRAVGWIMSLVAIVFLIYTVAGPYLPDIISHRGYSIADIIDYQVFGLDGIYSIPLSISATYIVLFIILGTLMEFTGAGDVIMDMGKALAGGFRGGPAKVATISSALFGSISGSAAANVYATGTFTIPMMKKIGYSPSFAGAVEAVASTGGQIMPPVMGAAAFLMAELLGMPYIQLCKAALIPALLYYISLFIVLDFEAARIGIKGMEKKDLPKWKDILPRLYLMVPLVVLVAILMRGYTPFKSAYYAILLTFFLSFFSKKTRFTFASLIDAFVISAKRTVMIAAACGAAGIVIGVITLTGIGLSLSSVILSLSGGVKIIALLLVMLSSIIMGMGTPTTVAYIVVSTLSVPIMKDLGFAAMPSHLFVFYFAVLSMITPPVALAAYAAADIAKESSMKIGFTAMRIGAIVFTIPFIFLLDPPLLMQGPVWMIVFRFAMTVLSCVAFAGAATGWYGKNMNVIGRLILLASFGLIISPELITTFAGVGVLAAMWFLKDRFVPRKLGRAAQPAR
ncbi:MAG: Sialic acid TRAP transporter permease protein SiaT [Firmicutes bacterium ADurb.Bin153]|nr:MAG: Sialic acid TRAP transporter permease protein SiaT [Firmicutes bacterium ADurb.Bin153]